MLGNYLKVAVRNIIRYKGYSFINIAGLAVGMACFILIALWVRDELSYDKFHPNADRLCLITDYEKYTDGGELKFSVNPPELAPTLIREYPEIVEAVRYKNLPGRIVRHEDRFFSEDRLAVADPSFLTLFGLKFIEGEPAQALSSPNSVVITQDMAGKYFGDADPMGKTLQVDGRADFTVSGIIHKLPRNSHLEFDFLVPFSAAEEFGLSIEGWTTYAYKIYVLIAENVDFGWLSQKIAGAIRQHHDQEAIVELSL